MASTWPGKERTTLQINVGLTCNLGCRHCHLEAGPHRTEAMDIETVEHVVAFAAANRFAAIDITGGAPELNPHLGEIITRLAPHCSRLMVRTNLTTLRGEAWERFIALCRETGVVLIASFPAINAGQTDSQRGEGTFPHLIDALKGLNKIGYGRKGSGLELDLVSNPTGAFLPGSQGEAEKRFRTVLESRWGVSFNHLYHFANAPLGRFRDWLTETGNLEGYLKKLVEKFNPCVVPSLMCRNLLSVDWEGYLYDCDFNLAAGLGLGGRRTHITQMTAPPEAGSPIAVSDHCYACTAGAGFT